MSNKLKVVKLAINVIAGAGVSKVVNDIIRNNTTVETTADAAKVLAGTAVFGSMAAQTCSTHVNAKIDQVAEWFNSREEDQKNPENQ